MFSGLGKFTIRREKIVDVRVGQIYKSNFGYDSESVIVKVERIFEFDSLVSTTVVDYISSEGRSSVHLKGKIRFYDLSSFSEKFHPLSLSKEEDML